MDRAKRPQRPLTGYDTATMAADVAELATHLHFDQFRVVGEDWGAAIAYAVAAFHRSPGPATGVPGNAAAGIAGRPGFARRRARPLASR